MQPHTPVIPGLGRSKWEDHDSKAATAAVTSEAGLGCR